MRSWINWRQTRSFFVADSTKPRGIFWPSIVTPRAITISSSAKLFLFHFLQLSVRAFDVAIDDDDGFKSLIDEPMDGRSIEASAAPVARVVLPSKCLQLVDILSPSYRKSLHCRDHGNAETQGGPGHLRELRWTDMP